MDDRCQEAPGSVASIADMSPASASLVTSPTPDGLRAVSDREDVSEPHAILGGGYVRAEVRAVALALDPDRD